MTAKLFSMGWLFVAGAVAVLVSCQSDEASEYYGSLLSTPSGLILEQSEHEIGWGENDCSSCHALTNFHQDRSDRSGTFNMPAVREFVEERGYESCELCHGDNGASGGNP